MNTAHLPRTTGSAPAPRFSTGQLVANAAIAAVGTGAAVAAVSGLFLPAVVGGLIGGVVGYTATNRIPADGDR